MHTKCEMVCTGLLESMLISSTALPMTWMAQSWTVTEYFRAFGPMLVLSVSNLLKQQTNSYRWTVMDIQFTLATSTICTAY